MLLSRLRIRSKLILLLTIPLLAILVLTLRVVLVQRTQALGADDRARAVRVAAQVGSLLQDLQQERLLSVGVLVGTATPSDLALKIASTQDRITDLRVDFDEDLSAGLREAIDHVPDLDQLRDAVLDRTVTPEQVMEGYRPVIYQILDSLQLIFEADTSTDEGRQVMALEMLLDADEQTAISVTTLVILSYSPSNEALIQHNASQTLVRDLLGRMLSLATPDQIALRRMVDKALTDRFGIEVEGDPQGSIAGLSTATVFSSVSSFLTLGNYVEKRIVVDVTQAVNDRRTATVASLHAVTLSVVLVLIAVVVLGLTVARSVATPLSQLTESARHIAAITERELVRVADGEVVASEPVPLDALDTGSKDEVGDLSRAFERVQSTAVRLVERQVASSRNIAEMFGHIGRRSHNLVSRQVSLIDEFEQEEMRPDRLRRLYQLDHLSNRLLRNASSLVVLSGAEESGQYVEPVSLSDAVRLALGQIEGYARVDLRVLGDVALSPAVVFDAVLIAAELIENATMFSPPKSTVTVTTERAPNGARLTIIDHGIGMSSERLAEENERLTMRERLDLVPVRVLGLFVVGRLARRHRMTVTLAQTLGGGVTATVSFGERLLILDPAKGLPSTAGAVQDDQSAGKEGVSGAPAPVDDLRVAQWASGVLASAQPWNAFQTRGARTGLIQRRSVLPSRQRAQAAAREEVPSGPGEVSRSGLRRRVPGANHPSGAQVGGVTSQPPDERDATAVKDLLDQFESGIARAMNDFTPDR